MNTSKILITGADRYIGQVLVERLLEQGHTVIAAYESSSALNRDFSLRNRCRLNFFESVIDSLSQTDLQMQVSGCDCVIHFPCNHNSIRSDQLRSISQTTQALLQACVETQVRKFIYISSTAVYGEPSPSAVITEKFPYLASLKLEAVIHQSAERMILGMDTQETETVVLQLGQIYGAGSGGETARMLNQMKTSFLPLIKDGSGYCNPLYVDDCVKAIICAVQIPYLHRQRFIISYHQTVLWKELLSGYESILGERALICLPIYYSCGPYDSIPFSRNVVSSLLKKSKVKAGVSAITKTLYGKPVQFPSVEEFRAMAAQPTFSGQKSLDLLEFQPEISFQAGIARIREWWQQIPETV